MNNCVLKGNLTKDPMMKQKEDKVTASFTLAVKRWNDECDFIFCMCNGKTAEVAAKYLKKGDPLLVRGALQSYKKEGVTNWFISVAEFDFIGSKKKEDEESDYPF